MSCKALLIALGAILMASSATSAADWGTPTESAGIFSGARMGIMSHDPFLREKGSIDIQGEVLFHAPYSSDHQYRFVRQFLSPRPHIGFSANTAGKTSYAYVGLTWNYDIWGPIFMETTFGGAIHNGETKDVSETMEPLGTRILFRESASIGFRYNQKWSIMATVEHLSNAGIGDYNHGLTHVGGKIGYEF